MGITATIITLNEERNIARCIKSLDFVNEIIVVDSNSTDSTCEIAKDLGATIIKNPFKGYGEQKSFAWERANQEWVLSIDADEEITEELKVSILNAVKSKNGEEIYMLNRLTNYCGKWIRHGGWHPDLINRLAKKRSAYWTTPSVHEELLPKDNRSKIGQLDGILKHYSFPTIESQVKTNVNYARLGAKDLIRRKNRKPYLIELLTRPIMKFIECYFLKLGVLDGLYGFIIAVNAAHSMFMKYAIAYQKNSDVVLKERDF